MLTIEQVENARFILPFKNVVENRVLAPVFTIFHELLKFKKCEFIELLECLFFCI